ncbi:16S rRNA processing protein RimM [hydrothermal vent metagenome]|uniref:16S rRNA processing protein RimM n=1 Tax=hydrothermal vent metagenome TaxID=652676 RepID=A0A3B0VN55_9ZZZZ
MQQNRRILIGKVSGCFGVKGWLKIFSYCNPRENITAYKSWIVANQHYDSIQAKKHGKLIVAKLAGIDDIETAQALINQDVEIDRQQLAKLADTQFYWHDLIGLQVSNTKGVNFGKITTLLETGANDVIVVKSDKVERLIPYIIEPSANKTIIKIDLAENIMLVDWHEDD